MILLASQVYADCNIENYTCITFTDLAQSEFGVEKCYGNNGSCIYYDSNESIPFEITSDFVVKIVPQEIRNINDVSDYIANQNFLVNLILLGILIVLAIALFKVIT